MKIIAGVAILLMGLTAPHVSGEIIHVTLPPAVIESAPHPGNPYEVDLDGSGTIDVTFMHVTGPPRLNNVDVSVLLLPQLNEVVAYWDGFTYNVRGFEAGQPMTGSWNNSGQFTRADEISESGDWADGANHYVGLRFRRSNQFHYAWLRVNVEIWSHTTVHEYAYETQPYTPIIAGAVPAPSEMAFLALIGIGFTRRRR